MNVITNCTLKSISAQFKWLNLLETEYLRQRFCSSMRFCNDSVFTEILPNRLRQNRIVFARFGSVWTGPTEIAAEGNPQLPKTQSERSPSPPLTNNRTLSPKHVF